MQKPLGNVPMLQKVKIRLETDYIFKVINANKCLTVFF